MPIYEYACDRCRMVFQFFFRSAASRKKPACPRCGNRRILRLMSGFAVVGGAREPQGEEGPAGMPDVDPARLDAAMSKLTREMASVDEDDPRQMGRLMRKLIEETGTDLGRDMDAAIRRLEAGEDPEKIEEDMGDLLGADPGQGGDVSDYDYDDTLYDA